MTADESPASKAADKVLSQLDVVEKSVQALRALIEIDYEERQAEDEQET